MADQTARPASPGVARLGGNAIAFVRTSIGFLPVVLLVRAYERFAAGATHLLPPGSAGAWLRALESDVALTLWLAAALALPVLAVAQWSPRVGRAMHRAALVVVALLGVALAQYFAVTLVPLGADLLGYSWTEVRETAMSSSGVSLLSLVPFVVAAAAAWIITGLAQRLPIGRVGAAVFGLVAVIAAAVPSLLTLPPSAFVSDTGYYLADNKTASFGRSIARHLASQWRSGDATLAGYPLMHRVAYDDVLGPRFTLGAQKPNFVFVIVEGLGRDFTGPNAEYGGFTPFLDSLAGRSLSWDNFLSTSGRTFGILPSLLGSLPFGESGFMELGSGMPYHETLGTVLKAQGYTTNYFTGSNGHFDNIDVFMERQGVDRFVDESQFGAGYVKEPGNADAAALRARLLKR